PGAATAGTVPGGPAGRADWRGAVGPLPDSAPARRLRGPSATPATCGTVRAELPPDAAVPAGAFPRAAAAPLQPRIVDLDPFDVRGGGDRALGSRVLAHRTLVAGRSATHPARPHRSHATPYGSHT